MSSIYLDLTAGIPWEVIRAPDVMAKESAPAVLPCHRQYFERSCWTRQQGDSGTQAGRKRWPEWGTSSQIAFRVK
jgi:hypothetical protein